MEAEVVDPRQGRVIMHGGLEPWHHVANVGLELDPVRPPAYHHALEAMHIVLPAPFTFDRFVTTVWLPGEGDSVFGRFLGNPNEPSHSALQIISLRR